MKEKTRYRGRKSASAKQTNEGTEGEEEARKGRAKREGRGPVLHRLRLRHRPIREGRRTVPLLGGGH